jgi:hypothetical protein
LISGTRIEDDFCIVTMSFVTKSTETYSIYFGVIAKKFKAKKKNF